MAWNVSRFVEPDRAQWVVTVSVLALFGLLLAYFVQHEHTLTLQRERDRLLTQIRVIDANLTQQFLGVNSALEDLRPGAALSARETQANQVRSATLRTLSDAMPAVHTMLMTDAQGLVLSASRPEAIGVDTSQAAYFKTAQRQPGGDVLQVAPPFTTALNMYALNLVKAWADERGQLIGVTAATLDPGYFSDLIRPVLYADDMRATLIHGDGLAFLTLPTNARIQGANLNGPDTIFRQHLASGQVETLRIAEVALTGDERMVAYRTVQPAQLRMDKPLLLAVSRDLRAVLSPWRQLSLLLAGAYALMCVVILGGVYFLRRNQQALLELTRARAQDAQEQAERLELALSGGDLGLFDLDVASGQRRVSTRAREIVGDGRADPVDSFASWRQRVHPMDLAKVDAAYPAPAPGQTDTLSSDYRVRHRSGHWVWLHSRSRVTQRDADGKPLRIVGTYMDISERKRAEEAVRELNQNLEAQVMERTASLRRSEREFRSTFEGAGLGIAHVSPQGRFLRVNPQLCAFSGYSEQELLGKEISFLPHPDDLVSGLQAFAPVMRGEASVITMEKRMRCKDGSALWINLTASLVRDEAGAIEYAICFVKDISQRKQAEAEFMAQQTLLRHILENLAEGVVACDADGKLTFFNKAARDWHGVDVRAIPAEQWTRYYDLYRGDGITPLPTAQIPLLRAYAGEAVRDVEMSIVARGQPPRFIVANSDPLVDADGRKIGAVAVMHDITERRQAELALRQANEALEQRVAARTAELARSTKMLATREEEIRSIVEYMVDCVISIDEHGLIRSANPAAVRLFGYAQAELIGRNVSMLMPEPQQSQHDGYLERYRRTGEARIIGIGREVTGRHKNGEPLSLDLAISQYELNGQRIFTGIVRDISERTRIMRELELARQAADDANQAKSAFLAAMSHEIRTPMNGVVGMIEVLERSSLQGEQVEMVELIRDSAASLLTIIDDILDFSKIEAKGLEIEHLPCSVTEVVDKVCAMLNRLAIKTGVGLTLFTDPAIPPTLLGDSLRLRQVLINLVNNAIKFSSGPERTGQVSVRATLVAKTAKTVSLELAVRDNGIGMDQQTLGRLFNAFTQADASTTRRFGGTGLGLVIARELTELMGGEITVQSQPGMGSVFRVRLELALAAQGSDLPATDAPFSQLQALRCLVIDDGQGIANDLAVYLAAAGATVERVAHLSGARAVATRGGAGQAEPTVWIVDTGDVVPALDELRGAARAAGPGDTRFVVVGRGGRRKPRLSGADVAQIDANGLTRSTFMRVVGIAAGRWSGDVELSTNGSAGSALATTLPGREDVRRQGRLILVAEDNATNQKVIQRQLALLGYVADIASDGAAALRRVASGDYGLLLTDLHMPVMDGYALTLAVRADEAGKGRHLPIIALTANAIKGEAEHCRAVGMDGYLSKPTTLDDLKAMLEAWLPASAHTRPVPVAVPVVEPLTSVAPAFGTNPMDLRVLQSMVGTDPAVIGEFLSDFRRTTAEIAAELKLAVELGQAATAQALAHKFKSSARSFGALALGDLCEALEHKAMAGDVAALHHCWPDFDREVAAVERYLASRLDTGTISLNAGEAP